MTEAIPQHPLQAQNWAGEMGEKWNRHHQQFESMIAPAGDAVLAAADFKPGELVLDVGCGAGATSLMIAARVAPAGRVTGLDIAPVLIDTARRRAAEAGLVNVEFVLGDATVAELAPQGFDCIFSRFGVMFFADPYRAFANLRRSLKPGGRLTFICWGPPKENPWAAALTEIARHFVDVPPAEPRAPGPFAFADKDYIHDILDRAGFTGVECTPWRGLQRLGGDGANAQVAARFAMDVLFIGEALADQSQAIKDQASAEVATMLAAYDHGRGVELPACAWVVTARG